VVDQAAGRSLPGITQVGGPVLSAAIGRAGRFPTGAQFKSYVWLGPRVSETGNTDLKGQPISKVAGSSLRATFYQAADTACKQDPQLAKIYFTQIVERGANHVKALCVVAAHLAERAWAMMARGMPYVLCDF
jgi:transposase